MTAAKLGEAAGGASRPLFDTRHIKKLGLHVSPASKAIKEMVATAYGAQRRRSPDIGSAVVMTTILKSDMQICAAEEEVNQRPSKGLSGPAQRQKICVIGLRAIRPWRLS
jgi:hypothetical protein